MVESRVYRALYFDIFYCIYPTVDPITIDPYVDDKGVLNFPAPQVPLSTVLLQNVMRSVSYLSQHLCFVQKRTYWLTSVQNSHLFCIIVLKFNTQHYSKQRGLAFFLQFVVTRCKHLNNTVVYLTLWINPLHFYIVTKNTQQAAMGNMHAFK